MRDAGSEAEGLGVIRQHGRADRVGWEQFNESASDMWINRQKVMVM